jgi:CHAD domain-containing protein
VDHRAALLVLLKQRLTTMLDAIPAAQAGDTRSVHQARVATRRLREALPVLRTSVSGPALSRVRRQVRKMTRALGPVRVLDVSIQHLDDLAAQNLVSQRALNRVRDALARERALRRREMLTAITPGKLERLREGLGKVSSGPEATQPAATLDESRRQAAKRARRLLDAVERAGGLYLADRLHAVRVAAKKLRYALEIDRELRRARSTARITQLKRLQDLLGRMHDYEVLIDWTRKVQAEQAATDRTSTLELDTLIRTLEAECRRDHALYMRRRPSIVKLCQALSADDADTSAVA